MANFNIKNKKFDAAYCTVDTFRHLLTEKEAKQHFISVAKTLRKNGIYVIGLHLVSDKKISNKVTSWTSKRGRLTVKSSMTMLGLNKKKRTETLKVVLNPITNTKNEKYESVYKLRTYTLNQFNKLLTSTNIFEVAGVFDHYYDLSKPIILNKYSDYAVYILRNKGS